MVGSAVVVDDVLPHALHAAQQHLHTAPHKPNPGPILPNPSRLCMFIHVLQVCESLYVNPKNKGEIAIHDKMLLSLFPSQSTLIPFCLLLPATN